MKILHNVNSKIKELPSSYWQFSSIEFLYWFAWGASCYLSLFLQSKGMNATQVGYITAICSAVGIFATPIFGTLSDKLHSTRKVLLLLFVMSGILWTLIPTLSDIYIGTLRMSFLIIPMASFFKAPTDPLMDSWAVHNANKYGLNYGSMRLWGSISFAIMNFSLSALMSKIGVDSTFHIFGIAIIPLIILCFTIKDDSIKEKAMSYKEMPFNRLFKNYYFVTFLIFSIGLKMPVNTVYTFLPYLMEEAEISTDYLGLIMAYKALLEIPILLLITKLRTKISLPKLMLVAAMLHVVESIGYAFTNDLITLLAVQTLHGLAGGLTIGCGANYIYSLAPRKLKATALSIAGSVYACAGIVGNVVGGKLLDAVGVRKYYMLAGSFILVSVIFFFFSLIVYKGPSQSAALINQKEED